GPRLPRPPPQGRPGGEGQWGHGPQQYQSGYGQYDQQGAYGQAYDGDMTPAPEIPADAGFDAADAPPAAPEAFRNDPSAGAAAGDARTTDETGTELDGAGAAARSSTQPRASSGAEAE
ncbi:MAG TPA: hypothetical protein PJ982_10435, partial [Lacipirellulaceae bacterium]|nr:hypothetical protein [Lacipirellulaceae bacterium]